MNHIVNMNTNLLLNGQKVKKIYAMLVKPIMRTYHVTQNELDVLLFLVNNAPLDTAKDITELRSLSKSHVCKSIESLCSRGFLATEQDHSDRRCVHLKVLPPAYPIVTAMQDVQQTFIRSLYQGVTESEQQTLERIFHQISCNIERMLEHGC